MRPTDSELLKQRETILQQQQELQQKNAELLRLNEHLEDIVRQRTSELHNANEELQAEIKERLQMEMALRDSESKFRSLLQSAPDAIVIVDEDGIIDLANEQAVKLFGFSAKDLHYKPVEMLLPEAIRDVHQAHRRQFLEKPYCRLMGEGMELYARTKISDTIPVEVALSPIQTQNGSYVIAAIRDISKRKQVEAELLTYRNHLEELVAERTAALSMANQELEEFSYTVSHDLRAPLRGIDGFSMALLEDFSAYLPQEAQDYLQRIRNAAQRMGRLIDEVLELARVSRCQLNKTTVDMTAMVKEITAEFSINEPEHRVAIDVAEGLTPWADEALLRVVLENLLDNAWKFTSHQPKGEVSVGRIIKSQPEVFFVKDNGVGLNMQYVSKLFSPFQRLHSEKDFPGTGVGLATVHRIIQRHGGRIWVESEPGQGASFYFTLTD